MQDFDVDINIRGTLMHRGKGFWSGKHLTEKHRTNISKSLEGHRQSSETRAKNSKAHTGKIYSQETRQKMSESHKDQVPWNKGKRTPPEVIAKLSAAHIGKVMSAETRAKMSENCSMRRPEIRAKVSAATKGRPLTQEHRTKISNSKKGKPRPDIVGNKNPVWNGGTSFEPYCPRFNEEFKNRVRAFFRFRCIKCGKTQEENGKKLHVHHVNYKKEACCDEDIPKYFAPLCSSCHPRTNKDREKWQKEFTEIIEVQFGGKCYLTRGEQVAAGGRYNGNI